MDVKELDDQNYYSIKQAADFLGVETYLLRYWEDELGMKILRTDTGRRIYDKKDLLSFQKIIEYRNSGMKLKNMKEKISQIMQEENDVSEKITDDHEIKNDLETEIYEEKLKEKIEKNKKIIIEKNKNNFQKNNNNINNKIQKINQINSVNKYAQSVKNTEIIPRVIDEKNRSPYQYIDDQNEKMNKLQELLSKAFQNALEESTEHMMKHVCTEVRDTVTKEIDYQFRIRDEKESEKEELRRMKEEEWMKSQEEHFRLLDEMLRAGTMVDRRKKKMKKEKQIK